MSTEEAAFRLKLIDDGSGPARQAARSFGSLVSEVERTERAVGRLNSRRVLGGQRVTMRAWANSTRPVQRGFRRMTAGIGGATDSLIDFGAAGSALKMGAIGALTVGAAAGTYAMGRLAGAVAKTATEYAIFGENARLALGQLAPDGDTGEGLLDLTKELSGRFGMDLQDTTASLQKLLASQFSTALSTDIIKMGADLRAIGAGAEDVKSAVVAISQIKGAGRLMGQELLQLANAGVSIELIRKEIGKLMGGKSAQEVIKLQEAGEIDADTAIQGILNAVKKKTGVDTLGEAGERFANSTIDGMVGRAKARGQIAALQIGDAVAGPLNKFVSRNLVRLDEFLASPEGMQKIEDFGRLLGDSFKLAGELLEEFGEGFLATFSEFDGIDGGRSILQAWSHPGTRQAVLEFGESLGTVARWVAELGATIARWSSHFDTLFDVVMWMNPATAAWKGVGTVAGWVSGDDGPAESQADKDRRLRQAFGNDDDLVAANDNGRRVGESFGQGMANGIAGQRANVWAQADALASAALEGSRTGIDAHSPSRETFKLGGFFGEGFAGGMRSELPSIMRAANDVATAPMGPVSSVASSMSGVGKGSAVSSSTNTTSVDVGGISIPITANGAGPQELEEVRRAVRQEMTRFFDGLAQTGT